MAEQRELVLAFGAGAILASLGWCWLNDERKRKEADAAGPPTLLRRSTVLVSDMEASLELYRDVLELEVIYDNVLPIGGRGLPTGVFDTQGRLVFLRSHEDHKVGVLGLLQYLDKGGVPRPESPRRLLKTGDQVLLMNTSNVAERMSKLKALPGVYVQSEGTVSKYPAVSGGVVTVLGNSFFGPDGEFVELNEIH